MFFSCSDHSGDSLEDTDAKSFSPKTVGVNVLILQYFGTKVESRLIEIVDTKNTIGH